VSRSICLSAAESASHATSAGWRFCSGSCESPRLQPCRSFSSHQPSCSICASSSTSLVQTNTIQALAFSPDGKTLAAGDGDGAACVYDVATLVTIGGGDCLLGHSSSNNLAGIDALGYLPDGTLLSGGEGNPLVEWNPVLYSERRDSAMMRSLGSDVCRFAGNKLTHTEWDVAFFDTPRLAHHWHATCG
jgi:WD40 repeat protein